MTSRRQLAPVSGVIDEAALLSLLPDDSPETERELFRQAWSLVESGLRQQQGPAGESEEMLRGSLEVAAILTDLQLDFDSMLAGFLHAAVRQHALTVSAVRNHFGEAIAHLLEGVLRMDAISTGGVPALDGRSAFERQHRQQETVRRMLVAMISDVRVALIKIAERTQALRAVKNDPERQHKVAAEVFDIYAPLAHRLGIGHIKWELEDLSFRYLEPAEYRRIAALLDERRIDRQQYIDKLIGELSHALNDANVHAEVHGRAKHIYSIWRKMKRKGISFSEVYDVRALRILVDSVRDCYTALGTVHGLWRNVPQEFDDYIAIPKANGYRSLHTAVYGPQGKVIEIQIRTQQMHREAELGVCSHWRYKGTDAAGEARAYEEKVAWLRQVLDWHESLSDDLGSRAQLDWDAGQDRVYVFTPEGHVVDLPNGATSIDFAYAIHTDVGHRCRGARVDGRIVPLAYKLATGERVEIITGKHAGPSRDWLRADLGFVCTARARTKIQHWFRRQARDENLQAGRQILEREFRRLALPDIELGQLSAKLGQSSVDDLYAAVGSGELSTEKILHAVQAQLPPPPAPASQRSSHRGRRRSKPTSFSISGVGNLMSQIAGCCKPVPGDDIAGYVTVGRGVSVHRQDCGRLLQLQDSEPERIVAVAWGDAAQQLFPVDVLIEAYDRAGLIRDITTLLGNERINLLNLRTQVNQRSNIAQTMVTLEVASLELLGRVLSKIDQITNVISVRRMTEGRSDE